MVVVVNTVWKELILLAFPRHGLLLSLIQLVFIQLQILNILMWTVLFCLLHIALLSVDHWMSFLSCTLKLHTHILNSTLIIHRWLHYSTEKHCCTWPVDSNISLLSRHCHMLCVPFPRATIGLQQGAAVRITALTWTLTLWSNLQAQELWSFNCPSSTSQLWSTLDKEKGQHKADWKHV